MNRGQRSRVLSLLRRVRNSRFKFHLHSIRHEAGWWWPRIGQIPVRPRSDCLSPSSAAGQGGRDDPVVYLAGGPGVSGLSAAAYPGAYPWLEDRDFIVLGQRGTQDAKPALMCPEYRNAVRSGTDVTDAVRLCRNRLTESGIGVENYHSPASAADLEDLRRVLEIEAWNLYAGSYGTRLALTYARDFGGSLRAMVLDSPLPPNAIYDDESAVNVETSLRAIASDCARQPACATAYPDLENRFFDRIETATRSPISVEGVSVPVTGADLVALIPLSSGRDVIAAPGIMDAIVRLEPDIIDALGKENRSQQFRLGHAFFSLVPRGYALQRKKQASTSRTHTWRI